MKKLLQFGENVDGYSVPVLNEREIRAAAGILFLFAFITLLIIIFKGNFLPAKFFVIIFLFDFLIRVLFSPRLSPTLIIGRFFVRNQVPEYVGAPQKKFSWIIGLVLAGLMFFLLIVLNTYSVITGIICLICLIFLFFESVFGICLGCIFYNLIYKEKTKYCPGDNCEKKEKDEIQKFSVMQGIMIAVFVIYIVFSAFLLKTTFGIKPENLWVKLGMKKEINLKHE